MYVIIVYQYGLMSNSIPRTAPARMHEPRERDHGLVLGDDEDDVAAAVDPEACPPDANEGPNA